jgi:CRISPR-associated protein Csm3
MLKTIYRIDFEIELLTGLHIGGSSDTFDIGSADSTVIKNPLTKEPYIPGSSIKGKLRSLLTQKYGVIDNNEVVIKNDYEGKVFKNLFENVEYDNETIQVSRAIFRDAPLTKTSKEELETFLGKGIYTEIKAENSISLLKGKAANPRFIERVPAGARFNGEIILHVYENDDEELLKKGLKEALDMLELNYLGGSGTRGYGKVKIHYLNEDVFEEVQTF